MRGLLCVCLLVSWLGSAAWAQSPQAQGEGGILLRLYDVGQPLMRLYSPVSGETPSAVRVIRSPDLKGERGDFDPCRDYFLSELIATLNIAESGEYTFRLTCDDGANLLVDDRRLIDLDGLQSGASSTASIGLMRGAHSVRVVHFDNTGDALIKLEWRKPDQEDPEAFEVIPAPVFSIPQDASRAAVPGRKRVEWKLQRGRPGDLRPLEGIHPAYDVFQAKGPGFNPRISGIDFLPDGRLVICSWDEDGDAGTLVCATDDWRESRIKPFAYGLHRPGGVCVVDGIAYCAQKQELTKLHDPSGRNHLVDEYWTVSADWPVTANDSELTFGPVYKDGAFYIALAQALSPDGHSLPTQAPQRGTVAKISPEGKTEFIAGGLRWPNGLAWGPAGELFATDTRGEWVPTGKLVHIKPQRFFGARSKTPGPFDDQPVTPPVAWLPHGEISIAPSQPTLVPNGPFKDHMLIGDVVYGGLSRVFLENVAGEYQGCVFQFAQGFEAGVHRLAWSADGQLFVAGIGMDGWRHAGRKNSSLQKLRFNGRSAFEMFAVRARTNGMQIEFTEAPAPETAADPRFYEVKQWRYEPTAEFAGPKLDEEDLDIKSLTLSDDRKSVFVELPGMKAGRVVYIRLLGAFRSDKGAEPWTTEAWYTLNNIPKDTPGTVAQQAILASPNVLTDAEQKAGWKLLFDGKTTQGWRGFKKQDIPDGWKVEDGCLTRVGQGGDIITADQFDHFELSLEWRIAKGGNSGIFYRVGEGEGLDAVWSTGPEMQVLDNDFHADGQNPLTSAGANYALHPAPRDLTLPVGRFNQARIVVQGNKVEHWLNGVQVCAYELNSDDWTKLIRESKFKSLPRYGREAKGHIALQDHGDKVWYRNIKIRPLPASGS